jgi:lysozyme
MNSVKLAVVHIAVDQLKADEGYSEKMYRCSRGFLTIGYGTNLDDGLDEEESEAVLLVRVKRCSQRLTDLGLGDIHPLAFAICLNMCYQLGFAGFRKFKKTIQYLERWQYEQASYEMLDSAWATQTPNRARRLSRALRALEV